MYALSISQESHFLSLEFRDADTVVGWYEDQGCLEVGEDRMMKYCEDLRNWQLLSLTDWT